MARERELRVHSGGCHCGKVYFEFEAPAHVVAWSCNCSICAMRRNDHIMVPDSKFYLKRGQDELSLYQFGTRTAKHYFCRNCGITSFYKPRSNPDGYGITAHCVFSRNFESVEFRTFDGQNWEACFQQSDIASMTKES
eukprot:gb/GECG01002570.1/.p1 GENE.gb/GECG01002570.1/~~gb/GECG01002570.1/.p1  ORF type:complete len:138 (+),score=4.19 gb/GECG01002570.1/:1-414(+)